MSNYAIGKASAAAALLFLLFFVLTVAALASHALQYTDSQTTDSGNWIWWHTGFDWYHNDGIHFRGYAANGGSPSAGGTFDSISVYDWAGSSCDNGLTWPYASSNNASLSNSTFVDVLTGSVFMPACSSFPKYRSSSSHWWEDGSWYAGKNQSWDQ